MCLSEGKTNPEATQVDLILIITSLKVEQKKYKYPPNQPTRINFILLRFYGRSTFLNDHDDQKSMQNVYSFRLQN